MFVRIIDGVRRLKEGLKWRIDGVLASAESKILFRLAVAKRPWLGRTMFIGITGSAGKTTTKDLLGGILERHFRRGKKGLGTLNGPDNVARLILETSPSDAYCVTEIAIFNEAGIAQQVDFFRPTVAVVTNIGGDHLSAYGSLDGIAEEKSRLVKALPPDGIAVLNADDPRVLAMRSLFPGRVITYGMGPSAMLRADSIDGSWPDRLSFFVSWNGQRIRVQTQLCGTHWVSAVLGALATSVALEIPVAVAAEAIGGVAPYEGRMSPVLLEDGVTFIRDDWKAPLWSIPSTLDFMSQARAGRKIIVMGTISDYSGDSTRRYVDTAREALAVADCVLFVGPRATACLRARRSARDHLYAFPSIKDASHFLSSYLHSGDLVLLKGSTRTEHLERLILARIGAVKCWRMQCGRWYWCEECADFGIDREADGAAPFDRDELTGNCPRAVKQEQRSHGESGPIVVVGLGNPGAEYASTPHNMGQSAVDVLAQRLTGSWSDESGLASVFKTHWKERQLILVKPLAKMNVIGPALVRLAEHLEFAPGDCVLVHDDLDLPFGKVRIRSRGSDGGHRGVRSVLQAFQDDSVRRVKIGVGKPVTGQSVEEYVLRPFLPEQTDAAQVAYNVAADRIIGLVSELSAVSNSV